MNLFVKIFVASAVALLLGLAIFSPSPSKFSDIKYTKEAVASVADQTYDWGTADIKEGNLVAEFKITNSGTQELKLFDVKTSCTCTTAQLVSKTAKSPIYSMHSGISYVMGLAPNKDALLRVIYDPAFHGPSGVGMIERTVTVRTNDSKNKKMVFELKVNIVNDNS